MSVSHTIRAVPDGGVASSELEGKKIAFIGERMKQCYASTESIRLKWRDNHSMFQSGSVFSNKADWQSQFSLGQLTSATRAAQAELVNIMVQNARWWSLTPKVETAEAWRLKNILEKVVTFYLNEAKFQRHAGTFFLNALLGVGTIYVGWNYKLLQNPEYILAKTKAAAEKEARQRGRVVANPKVETEFSAEAMASKIEQALEKLTSDAVGDPMAALDEKIPEYVEYGCLQFIDIHHEYDCWDTSVYYMEDSLMRAWRYTVSDLELNRMVKAGYISKSAVKDLPTRKKRDLDQKLEHLYRGLDPSRGDKEGIDLVVYYGPLVIDGKPKKDKWFCIIANDGKIIKEGDYPFWEPPGQHTPVVSMAVHQVPFKPTGAGIGDNATGLQRILDSNWQLVCDQFRFAVAGLNFIDFTKVRDKAGLFEGLEPGKMTEVMGDPRTIFLHQPLTSNLENQVAPVNTVIQGAIEQQTGISSLFSGSANLRSRTTAAETDARMQGTTRSVSMMAIDLEENFLKPVLQKALARILQFGIPDIDNNPNLRALLSEEEYMILRQLDDGKRMSILQAYYDFEIEGFTKRATRDQDAMRLMEFAQVSGTNPSIGGRVNWGNFIDAFSKIVELDRFKLLLTDQTQMEQIEKENALLLNNQMIMPSETDDHNLHAQQQGPLAQMPDATEATIMHVQMHMQAAQAQQMQAQNQGAQGGESAPPEGQPVQ